MSPFLLDPYKDKDFTQLDDETFYSIRGFVWRMCHMYKGESSNYFNELLQMRYPDVSTDLLDIILRSENYQTSNLVFELQQTVNPLKFRCGYNLNYIDYKTPEVCMRIIEKAGLYGVNTILELKELIRKEAAAYYSSQGVKIDIPDWMPCLCCEEDICIMPMPWE